MERENYSCSLDVSIVFLLCTFKSKFEYVGEYWAQLDSSQMASNVLVNKECKYLIYKIYNI